MKNPQNFDEQNLDELIVDLKEETLRAKRLVGKLLMNC